MSRRRVVVTGLGLVCPVGNTVAEGWANIVAGKSGIATITKFDASAFACHFAGEVKGFNVEDYIPGKDARHMDTFIHYGVAAALQAVKDAGGALSGFSPHIAAVDLPGKGRYYRLRVETQDGKRLCAVLVAKGLTCIPAGS